MLSNKDRALFHKWADALEEFKREDKSAAAKELRKERLAIEITWGGAEKLKQADKYYAERFAAGDAYFAEKQAMGNDIENEVAAEIGRRTTALNNREREIVDRTNNAEARDQDQRERYEAIVEREGRLKQREIDAHVRETANANTGEALESEQARLTNWEQALDSRDARLKAAIA